MRPIVFRVAASVEDGLGHLMRCYALAQAAQELQIPVHFIVESSGADTLKARHDFHGTMELCPDFPSQTAQGHWLQKRLAELNAAVLVVDGYRFSAELLLPVRKDDTLILVIDDGAGTLVPMADIVVNPAEPEDLEQYQQRNANAVFCIGENYRLMRQEFADIRMLPIDARHGIAIAMGGSDPNNLTIPLLQAMERANCQVPVRVISGNLYSHHHKLTELIGQLSFPVQHVHNCQNMADVWAHTQLAISAAGGSQFELGVCQTPSLLVVVAENQKTASYRAQTEGWCEVFDLSVDTNITQLCDHLIERAMTLCAQPSLLQAMSDAAYGRYDAMGCERILSVMSARLA